jgi:branched-chain amino acid aminotransferase
MSALPKFAFFEGRIVPYSEAKVGVMTHALNYGTGCFGGIRGYWNNDERQLYVFRPADHYKRFLNSAKLLCMNLGHDAAKLVDITLDVLRTEGYHEDVYIRPLAYAAEEGIGVRLHDVRSALTIFAIPFGSYMTETGAHVTFSSWRRVDDNAIPPRGKISGAYVNSAFVKTDAHFGGYDEALVLNQDGHISEGSAANFFMLRDGVICTPPNTDNSLEGITRRTTMILLKDELGMPVVERPIDRSEVYLADEAWFCGTGVQVASIVKVDHRPIGSGECGPVANKLRDVYFDVVRGRNPKYRDWCVPVYTQAAKSGG